MKRFIAILLVAIIALCIVACDEGAQSQTTQQNVDNTQGNASTDSQQSTDSGALMSTTYSDFSGTSSSDSVDVTDTQATTIAGTEATRGESDVPTTTASSEGTTSSPSSSTSGKDDETTTKKPTSSESSTSSTTKKPSTTTSKTTTTTKKTTTTTTKKTTTTTKKTTTTTKKTTTTTKKTTTTTKKTTTTTKKTTTSKPASSGNSSSGISTMEVFNLINAERTKRGLPAYKYYTAGQNGADTRAKELLTNFSHTRPNGTKWWTAGDIDDMCQSGAENIIKVTGYTAADIVAAQMNSEGHRANIISTQYTHAVIGYYNGALVQIFIKPK